MTNGPGFGVVAGSDNSRDRMMRVIISMSAVEVFDQPNMLA